MGGEGDPAGGSAQDRAVQLRARAERLKAEADRYERGAAGERFTAGLLAALPAGWLVRHDLSIPGSKANVDHVAIGPAGVFVIDTKNWRYPARVSSGTLWCSKYPKGQELETVAWETRKVAEAVGDAAPVSAILCLLGPVDGHLGRVGAVSIVEGRTLTEHLAQQPSVLGPESVLRVADLLDHSFPSRGRTVSGRPAFRDVPTSTRSADAVSGLGKRQGSMARPRPVARRSPAKRSRGRSRSRAGIGGLVASLIACAVLIFAAPQVTSVLTWLGERFGDRLADRLPTPTSTPSSVAFANTTPTALQLMGWACPGPGQGWTASLLFEGGSTWGIQTSPASSGPWKYATTGSGTTAKTITGIRPGDSLYARAGSIVTLTASPAAVPVVALVPPTTTC